MPAAACGYGLLLLCIFFFCILFYGRKNNTPNLSHQI
jgi:hypothetical protein